MLGGVSGQVTFIQIIKGELPLLKDRPEDLIPDRETFKLIIGISLHILCIFLNSWDFFPWLLVGFAAEHSDLLNKRKECI